MASEEDLGVLETIRDMHRRDPFVPFEIVMTSGTGYTIERAERLAIGRSQLIYCLPDSDRVAHLRMSQIASIHENEPKTRKGRR